MDPISQGVLGATAAQAFGPRALGRHNAWIGWLAGMAADLDVLIRSASDPLLGLEYHRHFTHSFAFVPLGTLLVALPCWGIVRAVQRRSRGARDAAEPDTPRIGLGAVFACSLIAYLTHAPLDACTSYGTLLFWPFSDYRFAWDWLPVVDPVVTVALLVGFVAALRTAKRRGAIIALCFFGLYVALAALLHARAQTGVQQLAAARGHRALTLRAMPKLPTIFLWRGVYATRDRVYVNTLRVVPSRPTTFSKGRSRPRYATPNDTPETLVRDIARFQWFAQGLTAALEPQRDGLAQGLPAETARGVVDLRYGPADRARPLWGITWDAERPEDSLRYRSLPTADLKGELGWAWAALLGRDRRFEPLPDKHGAR